MLVSEKATDIVIPEEVVAMVSPQLTEKATITMKPTVVVPEKATVTTKPAAVVPEKATVTTKPAAVAFEQPVEDITGIIKNGSFSADTRCWNILKVGSGQIMNVSVINDSDKYPHALDINRQGSSKQKGLLGLSQSLNLDVSTHTLITLSADVKVLSATLNSDGTKGGVYPVTMEITYSDKAGKECSWRHGFLAGKRLNYREIGEIIAGNTWFAYKSPNLAMLKPRPAVITCVKVYGEGWGFHGRVTNLMLVSEKATDIVIPEEVVAMVSPQLTEKATITTKPAAVIPEKAMVTTVVEKPAKLSEPVTTGQITPEEMKEILEQVALPETGTPSSGVIKNSSFSTGLKYWQPVKSGEGELSLKIVKESTEYPSVLEISRTNGGKTKGRIGVFQDVNLPVADNKLITVSANIKILSSTLDSDGTKGGVYPITIELEYSDKIGNTHSWRHGFLAGKRLNYREIGEIIAGNTWFAYKSPNLAMLKPRPAVITCVKVYGEGWGFHGRVANLMLVSEKAQDIVISEEVETALATVRSEKATITTKPATDSGQLIEKAMTATTVITSVVEEKSTAIAVEKPTAVSQQSAVSSQQLTNEATATMKPPVDSGQLIETTTATTVTAPVVEEKPATIVAETPTQETPQPTPAEKTPETLIKNGDFTNGLNSWEETKEGVAITKIEVVNDSSDYPFVLEINRKESNGQKGFLGLKQKINKKVDDYTLLAVVMDIKVVSSSLENDGTDGGEYPLCIEISYEDRAGIFYTWRQGFLYAGNINYPKIGERVPKDKWYIYLSGNLLKLEPKPKILKEIKIYGQGQDFVARIANLSLIGGKMKIPREGE